MWYDDNVCHIPFTFVKIIHKGFHGKIKYGNRLLFRMEGFRVCVTNFIPNLFVSQQLELSIESAFHPDCGGLFVDHRSLAASVQRCN